jgi:hypothetical protein
VWKGETAAPTGGNRNRFMPYRSQRPPDDACYLERKSHNDMRMAERSIKISDKQGQEKRKCDNLYIKESPKQSTMGKKRERDLKVTC